MNHKSSSVDRLNVPGTSSLLKQDDVTVSLLDKSVSADGFLDGRTEAESDTRLMPRSASCERVLLGVAPRQRLHVSNEGSRLSLQSMIRITEVAPSSLYTDGTSSWRMPLSIFSEKKKVSKRDDTKLTRRIRSYYKAQDELITAYENLQVERPTQGQTTDNNQRIISILSKVSFACNFLLLIGKTVAVAMSSSISIISSLVDSVVDLLSGVIIWWTSSTIKKKDILLYPSGRTRLEPIAIVVLSVVMSLASLQIVIESIQKIVAFANFSGDKPKFDIPTIIIAGSTVVIKFVLFVVCYRYRSCGSSVQVLMQDHRNDTISNTVALICGYLGSTQFVEKTSEYNVVFIDPIGAIIIGFYILVSWWQTGWDQIKLLTGHTAKPDFLKKITWICINHHKSISQIDTVRAFHFGNNFLVEVDIVLPETMTLGEAHNIGETLQQRLEKLEEVERAFVHLDFETSHRPEEEHKIV